jgi:hypothetical protein
MAADIDSLYRCLQQNCYMYRIADSKGRSEFVVGKVGRIFCPLVFMIV